jgi:hypothetical protein
LKKILILLVFLLPASLILLSCGGYSAPSGGGSGIKYRAFITNIVSAGTGLAGVYIVDAANDVRGSISPISAGTTPEMMVLTPNRTLTLVFSPGINPLFPENQFTIITNAGEAAAGHVTLPGLTESFVVSPDSSAAYVAVPTAPVIGQSPGIVEAISLGSGTVTGQVDVPSAHFLSIDNSGNRILAFSDNSDSVAVITPSNIEIGNAVTPVVGFDRPVAAFFSSDDSTAYVLNCGAECGGQQASIQQLDLTHNTLVGSAVPVCAVDNTQKTQCAGSVFLVSGSTMYIAGTPYSAGGGPSLLCSTGTTTTQATYCGMLTIFDLSKMSVTNSTPIVITDGYHNRIALGANGQLFIGSSTCTEIVPPVPPPTGAEARGCLSIYNTQSVPVGSIQPGAVTIPPITGDVTGIQPIATRDVVYVVQGGNVQGGTLYVYDTKTDAVDAVEEQKLSNLIGDFVDIKTIDF